MGIQENLLKFSIDDGPHTALKVCEDYHLVIEGLLEIANPAEREGLYPVLKAIHGAMSIIQYATKGK